MTSYKKNKILTIISIVFIAYFLFALYQGLVSVKWDDVFTAVQTIDDKTFIKVLLAAFINYMVLVSFDQLAVLYLQEGLNKLLVLRTALISYVLNLNLGALLGGVGVRYRLYKKQGLDSKKITLIVLFASLSNWIAYLFIFGLIILISTPKFLLKFSPSLVRLAAVTALVLCTLYLLICIKGSSLKIKSTLFKLPKLHLAVAQIIMGSFQWILQGVMIYTLFEFFNIPLSFYDVLGTFLVAAIAGVLTHIPSGLGVLEAVFLSLTPSAYHHQVLASLMCFRAIYYLLPLCFALPTYLYLEARGALQSTNQH